MDGMLCIINSGIRLNDEDRRLLIWSAQKMYEQMKQSMKISSDQWEGRLKTDFVTKVVGTFSGIVFTADLMTERGEIKIVYAVRKKKITEKELDTLVFCRSNYSFDLSSELN